MSVARARRFLGRPSRTAVAVIAIILVGQLSLLGLYLSSFQPRISYFLFYPIIWITVSCWVLLHARSNAENARQQLVAAGIALLYFLLLAYLGGIFSLHPTTAPAEAFATGLRIEGAAPPGYAPALFYVGSTVTLALIPYLLVGYVTLAYLVYITILDTWKASAPGLLGIFGCIGCSWPILASLVASAGGMTGAVATAVYDNAYPLSTIAFLLAVGLLYWRPAFGTIRRWLP